MRDVLTSGGRTLAQGALAWVWGRGANTVPIPGFRTVRQVEENAGALALGPLPDDQMRRIDRLLQRGRPPRLLRRSILAYCDAARPPAIRKLQFRRPS